MKKISAMFVCLLLTAMFAYAQQQSANLIPLPRQMEVGTGSPVLSESYVADVANLIDSVQTEAGWSLEKKKDFESLRIRFTADPVLFEVDRTTVWAHQSTNQR